MVIEAIVTLLLTAPQTPSIPEQLVLSIVVTDKKGKPIADFALTEVRVTEGSATVPVARLERDTRPLKVAVVVDTSASMSDTLQSDAVPAVLSFLKRLPHRRPSRSGLRPIARSCLIEQTSDVKAAEGKLRSTPALGNNAAVETLVVASQELARAEGTRSAIALVTSSSMGDVTVDVQALLPKASLNRPTWRSISSTAVEWAMPGSRMRSRCWSSEPVVFTSASTGDGNRDAAAQRGRPARRQYRVAWKPAVDRATQVSQPQGREGRAGARLRPCGENADLAGRGVHGGGQRLRSVVKGSLQLTWTKSLSGTG